MSRQVFRSTWERQLGKTDSPIEAEFLEAFCRAAGDHGYSVAKASRANEGTIIVVPQKQIDRYRVDFLITYPFFGTVIEIVAECDGHDFHEKTKVQASRDKRRDRDLQRLGYKVFRFTGSDIRGDARGCASDVLDAIMDFQTVRIMAAYDAAELRKVA
jgi:very-short-patch-repair endonuclease